MTAASELMALADALAKRTNDDGLAGYSIGDPHVHYSENISRTALSAAITAAMEKARREGLEEAAKIPERWAETDWHGALCASQIRALIDNPKRD